MTGWTGQQLVYAGHRKAELRGRFPPLGSIDEIWKMRSCLLLTFFPSKTVWAEHKSATRDRAAIHWHRDARVAGTFATGESKPLVSCRHKSERVRLIIISPPPPPHRNKSLPAQSMQRACPPPPQADCPCDSADSGQYVYGGMLPQGAQTPTPCCA